MAETEARAGGRIIGIGGLFFKSEDHDRLKSWYKEKLGLDHGTHGYMFKWRSFEQPEREYVTVWSIFPETSNHFDPSKAQFMINYVVEDLDGLLEKMAKAGVEIDPKREDHEYGRFAWVHDPDGNKIELWEPPAPDPKT